MVRFHTVYLFILILLFIFNLKAAEKPYIISGFDDVLRQAENTGIVRVTIKILETDKTFSGMPELYEIISEQEAAPKFIIVSGISTWFDARIDRFLHENKFPPYRKYLRNWLTQRSIEDFKITNIKQVITERRGRKFIVILDNSDASVALTKKLHEKFPNQILAIYLRKVVETSIPATATSFYTAFDIALAEFAANRMTTDQVEIVGKAILNEQQKAMLFPNYSICPKNNNACDNISPAILAVCKKVQIHIESLCHHP
jgi:phosphatidate phosphatase APP1